MIADRKKQNAIMAVIAVSVIMFTIDYSMVNLALPAIARSFNTKLTEIAWVPLVYLLIVTSSLLGFGKLGDIKGYKNIFILGLFVIVSGTTLCGFAPGMKALLAFRAFQSFGEAMLSPAGIAILTSVLPHNIKGKALGIVALAQGTGLTVGPILAGAITAHFGWRFIFFVNVPIGIIAMLAAIKVLPAEQQRCADKRFDIVGAALTFVALSALIFGINSGAKMGWLNPVIIGCFAVSVAAFVLFLIREKRVPYPLLDLGLFKNRDFVFGSASIFFAICIFMGLYFLIPFYLEMVLRLDMSRAGVILMAAPLAMMVSAPLSGKLSDTIGSRFLCSLGMVIAVCGMFASCFLSQNTKPVFIIPIMCLLGLSMGIFMPPNNKLIMINAPDDKQGVAGGFYKMLLGIGAVFGIALFPIVLMGRLVSEVARRHIMMAEVRHMPDVMMVGFHSAFAFGLVICLAALACSVLAKDRTYA
jgi:EmrB/QacA subfamily drug resistance transporter